MSGDSCAFCPLQAQQTTAFLTASHFQAEDHVVEFSVDAGVNGDVSDAVAWGEITRVDVWGGFED